MIAETMARAGFGVQLTDKRGVGASEGKWRSVGFHALAGDAVAGVVSEQSFHEMANTARQEGLSPKQVAELLELNREAARFAHTGEWEPYAQMLEEALRGPLARRNHRRLREAPTSRKSRRRV